MNVSVRYFASLVETVGTDVETVALEPGEDVDALWRRLVALHPGLDRIGFKPLVACDLEYADWSRSLDDVSEVAFLPPVSGG